MQEAAQATGLPYNVVAAQAQAESNFNANAVSSAGAEGWLQFMPGTYNSVAAAAGVPANTEFNVADETKAYIVYMQQLLQQEGGSVFKALEAYNAGPGNLNAGSGYATGIMAAAGQPTNATTTGFTIPNPLNLLNPSSDIQNIISGALGNVGSGILGNLGIPSLKDLLERLGLILLGVALILVGLNMLTKIGPPSMTNMLNGQNGQNSGQAQNATKETESTTEETTAGAGGATTGVAAEAGEVGEVAALAL